MMKDKILLVEDSPQIQMVVESLVGQKADVTTVSQLKEADSFLEKEDFSLVILDVSLPDGCGFELCGKIRDQERFKELPIIFLTGKTDVADRVRGLNLGADDYVTKPIEPEEFTARVEANLRRRHRMKSSSEFSKFNFQVDPSSQRVSYVEGNKSVMLQLTPIEFRLFNHFLKNEGKVFSREKLIEIVWGKEVNVSEHTVDTHISSLRKKLSICTSVQLKAISRQGYCFRRTGSAKNH